MLKPREAIWMSVFFVLLVLTLLFFPWSCPAAEAQEQVPMTTIYTYVVVGRIIDEPPDNGNGNDNDNENENENENDNGTEPPEPPQLCEYFDLPQLDFYRENIQDHPDRPLCGQQPVACGAGRKLVRVAMYDLDTPGEALLHVGGALQIEFATDPACDKIQCFREFEIDSTGAEMFTFYLDPCPATWPHCPELEHSGYRVDWIKVFDISEPQVQTLFDEPEGWFPVTCVAVEFANVDNEFEVYGQSWSGPDGELRINVPYGVQHEHLDARIVGVIGAPTPEHMEFVSVPLDDWVRVAQLYGLPQSTQRCIGTPDGVDCSEVDEDGQCDPPEGN